MNDLAQLKLHDEEIFNLIQEEKARQQNTIGLIASENLVSGSVLETAGSVLTNKYSEGYPSKRYYNGCASVDKIEAVAIERAKKLFGAEHANVQPHSGASANLAVFFAVLNPGETFMGMELAHGGHLTHGSPVNISGKYFNAVHYQVSEETGTIDYEQMRKIALECKPKLIIAGASSYSRFIDFAKVREIADEVGAYYMVDMAHVAGLVAAGLHPSPVPYADFVTSTTHKTLRGPRGGLILCKEKYAKLIDKAIFPGTQGGPLEHIIAAKAVAFGEALKPEFKKYQQQVLSNCQVLASELKALGLKVATDGTDNHLVLVDLRDLDVTGEEIANRLEEINIVCNKNTIPFETKSATKTSGIRLGTPLVTTRGFKEEEMIILARIVHKTIFDFENSKADLAKTVSALCEKYPIN